MKGKIKLLLVGLGSEIGSTLISILNSKKDKKHQSFKEFKNE